MSKLFVALAAACSLAAATLDGRQPTAQDDGGIEVRGPRGQVVVDVELPGQRAARSGAALRSSSVAGMEVQNSAGEKLGSIEDLVIDLDTGKVRYAAKAQAARRQTSRK